MLTGPRETEVKCHAVSPLCHSVQTLCCQILQCLLWVDEKYTSPVKQSSRVDRIYQGVIYRIFFQTALNHIKGKGKGVLLSLFNELYNETARLEWITLLCSLS